MTNIDQIIHVVAEILLILSFTLSILAPFIRGLIQWMNRY